MAELDWLFNHSLRHRTDIGTSKLVHPNTPLPDLRRSPGPQRPYSQTIDGAQKSLANLEANPTI